MNPNIIQPGEYVNPLPRKTFVRCAVVSGYVAARLQAQDMLQSASGNSCPAFATFENTGNTSITVLLRECSNRSTSGIRTNLTSDVVLAAGGFSTESFTSNQQYLEVFCSGTTSGDLRLQIESNRRWTELGFDRLDSYYPAAMWQGKTIPGPL